MGQTLLNYRLAWQTLTNARVRTVPTRVFGCAPSPAQSRTRKLCRCLSNYCHVNVLICSGGGSYTTVPHQHCAERFRAPDNQNQPLNVHGETCGNAFVGDHISRCLLMNGPAPLCICVAASAVPTNAQPLVLFLDRAGTDDTAGASIF